MLGNVDRQRRLAHGRSGRQHNQVAGLKSGSQSVQIIKTGRHTRHIVRVVGHLGDAVQQRHHQRIHGLKTLLGARSLFADIEDLLLGFIQNAGHGPPLRVEGVGAYLVAGTDQFAQNRTLPDNFCVAPDIASAGHVLRQRIQVGQTTDFLGPALSRKLLKNSDNVGRSGQVDQCPNGCEHHAVLKAVEVVFLQQIAHPIPCRIVEQQPPEDTGFRLDRVRWNAQLGYLSVLPVVIGYSRKYSGHGVSFEPSILRQRRLDVE